MVVSVKVEPDHDDDSELLQWTGTNLKVEDEEPRINATDDRPMKRRRVLDAVVVLSFNEVIKQEKKLEDIGKTFKAFKNPKSKLTKKEQEMCISDYVLYSRLKNIQLDLFLIDLDKFTLDKTISRDFMSDRYGGSNIACFPTIGREKLEHHGRDNFMYMNMRYHPHAPQVPGAPGLYFHPGEARSIEWDTVQLVFTRLTSGKWCQMGDYELAYSKPLSAEEWNRPDMKTMRNTWSERISIKSWGRGMRCSVKLRARLGREPTDEEYNAAIESDDKFLDVTPQEISNAVSRGEEVFSVWTMKCVGYDIEFQKTITEQFSNWTPPPKKPKKTASESKSRTDPAKRSAGSKQKKVTSKVASKKRKAVQMEDTDEGSDYEAEIVIPRGGTRSRPNRAIRVV